MQRLGVTSSALLLLWAATALAQQPTSGQMEDVVHDGWYFRGSTAGDAAARVGGPSGALVVDCHGTVPRVIVFFRETGLPYGAVTTTRAVQVTFRWSKRSLASAVTSQFDRDQVQLASGQQISSGRAGEPPISEHVNFDGAQAMKIVASLKSMDHVSINATDLGQPLAFELRGAEPVIDQMLTICSKS
jgi:hypothetical protein